MPESNTAAEYPPGSTFHLLLVRFHRSPVIRTMSLVCFFQISLGAPDQEVVLRAMLCAETCRPFGITSMTEWIVRGEYGRVGEVMHTLDLDSCKNVQTEAPIMLKVCSLSSGI